MDSSLNFDSRTFGTTIKQFFNSFSHPPLLPLLSESIFESSGPVSILEAVGKFSLFNHHPTRSFLIGLFDHENEFIPFILHPPMSSHLRTVLDNTDSKFSSKELLSFYEVASLYQHSIVSILGSFQVLLFLIFLSF